MNDVTLSLREFILATYLPGEPADTLDENTPLITSGILDSLAVLTLATFVHERFGVELGFQETSVERFNRISDIVATIGQRAAGPKSVGGTA